MLTHRFPAASAPVAALDVGGTSMKGVVVDADGRRVAASRWPTPCADGPDAAVDAVLNAVAELVGNARDPIAAVGLVVPGVVDELAGVGTFSENIGWRDVPFRELAARRTGLPVAFGHDVRSAGLAERELGAARGARDVLVLPVGTGISGAMFVEGRLVHNPYAGEIGHVRVADHEPCVCGAVGCLEAISSAAAIARRYRRTVGAAANDVGNGADGAAGVVAALRAGDEVAARVWQEAIDGLAAALAAYTSVLAPELIVLAGGLSGAGETLLDPLRTGLRERLTWQPVPRLTVAEFGEDAACVGAVLLARGLLPDAVRTHP